MSLDPNIETRRQIAEQAAFWMLTLQSEDLTEVQRAEFVDWLRQSPLNISEMLRISQLQRDLSNFPGWRQVPTMNPAQPSKIIQLLAARAAGGRRASRGRIRGATLLAAAAAAVCMAVLLIFARTAQSDFKTQLGERREVTLADGSVVDLAPASEVVVRFRPRERLVTLEHGNVLFHVAKSANRPFIVQAALTRVRAVGTVFDVARGAQGVSVSVIEGRVAVSQQPLARFARTAAELAPPVLSLEANEQVSINLAGVTSAVRNINGAAEVSSGTDELAFENETVGEVTRRFNLRNAVQIEIVDPRLAERRISGVFHASDPQSFVSFIQDAADMRVLQRDAGHIVLGSRNSDSKDSAP